MMDIVEVVGKEKDGVVGVRTCTAGWARHGTQQTHSTVVGCAKLRRWMGPSRRGADQGGPGFPRLSGQVRHLEANEASPQPSKSKKTTLPCPRPAFSWEGVSISPVMRCSWGRLTMYNMT